MRGPPAKTVDQYLTRVPDDQRAALETLRATIHTAAPGSEEYISYQIPTFRYRSRPLVAFAAFAKHCSFFPMSNAIIEADADALTSYGSSGKGTIRFTPQKPLPVALVRKIVKARMREIDAREAERAKERGVGARSDGRTPSRDRPRS